MPFTKKFPNSGETSHIRVPKEYAELVEELMIVLDSNYELEKGKRLLKKFISNLS